MGYYNFNKGEIEFNKLTQDIEFIFICFIMIRTISNKYSLFLKNIITDML